MKYAGTFKPYILSLFAVTLWPLFAWFYLGVEDGSSGLGILGFLQSAFFIPAMLVLKLFQDAYSNADLPIAGFLSWIIITIVTLTATHIIILIRKNKTYYTKKRGH